MNGLELAQAYYQEHENQLREIMGEDFCKISIGLCGQGSECFGFDDEISKDHDFGPGFCIFLDDELKEKYGEKLEKFYEGLPKEFMGMERMISSHGQGRVGVLSTKDFYFANLGIDKEPENLYQWYQLSEERLAMVTNGRIFHEGDDDFMKMRKIFLDFYPEEVRIKKLASRFAVMTQAGQYNYGRCLMRKDYVAAYFALSLFMKNAVSAIYLLNHQYMPFYKWAHYGMKDLPVLGNLSEAFSWLSTSSMGIVNVPAGDEGMRQYEGSVFVEMICGEIVKECVRQGLLKESVDFLDDGVPMLQEFIKDDLLQRIPLEI